MATAAPEPRKPRYCRWKDCGKLIAAEKVSDKVELPHCQSSTCDWGRECYIKHGGKLTDADDKTDW